MRHHERVRVRRIAALLACVLAIPAAVYAADPQLKAKKAEAKRLLNLGRAAEKQGKLLDARAQYLASEHVLYTEDAEKALEHIAEVADGQVKSLMSQASSAYAAEHFDETARLLESARQLHPGHLSISCNTALTMYQQGNHGDAVTLLNQCVDAMRDKDARRRLAELSSSLTTGDRRSGAPAAARPQIARLNDLILKNRDADDEDEDDVDPASKTPGTGVCAQLKQLQTTLPNNPALIFDLASCAESGGRFDDASRLLTQYKAVAPAAVDGDAVDARLAFLKQLVDLPAPQGDAVRALYTSAAHHAQAHDYAHAVADYQKADETLPQFLESKRRVATLLEAQGQMMAARTYWRRVADAESSDDGRKQAELIVNGLDAERGQYDELVSSARKTLQDLLGRAVLEGQPVGRIYAAYRLQLANDQVQSASLLLPLAPEVNLLEAFACSQMNDFRCVRASFDAVHSQTLPVYFYGAVFYKGVEPKKRPDQERLYAKFEFDRNVVRFVEISTVKPKKRTALVAATVAGEDRLGRLGVAEGLRTGSFQGFTVSSAAIKHLETDNGIIYLEVDDKRVKHRKMQIEPLSFVLQVPQQGPGARRYMNNYLNIASTYGGVARVKLGKESTTAGEKFKMVYNVASIGMSVTSVMFGDFSSILDVATGVNTLGHNIGMSRRQARHIVAERREVVDGPAFKAIPSEPVSLAFRQDLK